MRYTLFKSGMLGFVLIGLFSTNAAVAGPFEKFFQPASDAEKAEALPSQQAPRVWMSDNLDRDLRRLIEDGYMIIGSASFAGPIQDPKKSLKIAKKIKSEIVLFSSSYESTKSGAAPMLLPNNSTTTVNGSIYGNGGFGGFGGTVNRYGTTPVVVPYSVDRYNQTAYFFAKRRPETIGLGIGFDTLEPSQARSIGTNKAIVVQYVIRSSPAFEANLFSGDIILSMAGRDVSSTEKMRQMKIDFAGQTVPVEIVRDGSTKVLQITVPTLVAPTAQD